VQLWNVESRRRVGRAIAPGAGHRFSPWPFSRDGSLLATGSQRASGSLGRCHPGPPRKPMKIADDGVLGVAFEPKGPTRRRRGFAIGPVRVGASADQQPAFPPLTGHTAPVTEDGFSTRPETFLRQHKPVRRDQALEPGDGCRLRRRADQRQAGFARSDRRPSSVPRLSECLQPRRETAGRPGSRDARDGVARRPRGLAPSSLRGRGAKPESRGVEALPPVRDALSRHLLGVADGLRRTLPNLAKRSESVPSRQARPSRPGDCFARSASRALRTQSQRRDRDEVDTGIHVVSWRLMVAVLLAVSGTCVEPHVAVLRLSVSAELLPRTRGLDGLRFPADQGECPARRRSTHGLRRHLFGGLRKLSPKLRVVNYGCRARPR
jgi:hypothetical protein